MKVASQKVKQFGAFRWTAVALVFTAFIAAMAAYFLTFHGGLSTSSEDWAAFGALVGGVAGSGIALIALIVLHWGVQIQKAEFAAITEHAHQQNFESTLFQMIRMHLDNLTYIEEPYGQRTLKGQESLHRYSQIIMNYNGNPIVQYNNLYKNKYFYFGNYFRTLYRIFKYIDTSSKTPQEHADLLKGQISSPEVFVLLLNGLTQNGARFKTLIEKFAILEHLDDRHRDHLERYNLLDAYENSAFETP